VLPAAAPASRPALRIYRRREPEHSALCRLQPVLARFGLRETPDPSEHEDPLAQDLPLLAAGYAGSVQGKAALGERRGRSPTALCRDPRAGTFPWHDKSLRNGFTLGSTIAHGDRDGFDGDFCSRACLGSRMPIKPTTQAVSTAMTTDTSCRGHRSKRSALRQRQQPMRPSLLGIALCALGCVSQSACSGAASAEYVGTVVEALQGEESGHSFDVAPNPAGLAPIVGAKVRFCLNSCVHRSDNDITDENGAWGPLGSVFSTVSHSTTLIVEVEALHFLPYEHRAVFDETSDPTNGQKYFNIRLAPRLRPAPQDDAGTPDAGADAGVQ
jgi:hypothetical protein